MTDNEIIKALECCCTLEGVGCRNCPQYDIHSAMCVKNLIRNALDLINRQKAEIERLKAENKSIRYCYEQAKSYNDTLAESCEKNCKHFNMTTRAEAIKNFAERLKEKCYENFQETYEMLSPYVTDDDIDNIVKEMTEVNENE